MECPPQEPYCGQSATITPPDARKQGTCVEREKGSRRRTDLDRVRSSPTRLIKALSVHIMEEKQANAEDVASFIKVAVLGGEGVGKTALIQRLCGKSFDPTCPPTSTREKTSEVTTISPVLLSADGGHDPQLSAERLDARLVECPADANEETIRNVLEETFCTILVYDVTNRESFRDVVKKWYPLTNGLSPESFKMLVGCKMDRIAERDVEVSEMLDELFFIEVDAALVDSADVLVGDLCTTNRFRLQTAQILIL